MGSYFKIASTRLTGNQSSITLGSIPTTYKHLQLRLKVRGQSGEPSGSGAVVFYFNSISSGTNYPRQNFYCWGTNFVTAFYNNTDQMTVGLYMRGGGPANYSNGLVCEILDYASTSKYKLLRAYGGVAGDQASGAQNNSGAGLGMGWLATNNPTSTQITSITITPDQSGFGAGTTFSIYGIKDS